MNQTSLDKKYKDRDPKETVKIIKNFFNSKNLTAKETELVHVKDSKNIFASTVELYYNNIKILEGYGKGNTGEFCSASGYAELYERFCNSAVFINNVKLFEIIQDLNHQNYNYYLDPNEKQISVNELLDDQILDIYNKWYSNPENYLRLILNNKFIGIPFKSIQDSEVKYYNPRVIINFSSSNGMSAGNTLEEALVQGISELFERYVIKQFVDNLNDTYYFIDNNLLSESNKQIITDIESTNKKVQIFDLSYNFKFPVVMTTIRSLDSNNIAVNFASNPIFDIAVERTLTEIYQHQLMLENDFQYQQNLEYLRLSLKDKEQLKLIVSHPYCNINIIPESVFINATKRDDFNSNSFLDSQNYTNNIILEHIKSLCKDNNIRIYYYDNSGIPEMKAIHIYSPELSIPILRKDFIDTDHIITDIEQLYNYTGYNTLWHNTRDAIAETIDFIFRLDALSEVFIVDAWSHLRDINSNSLNFETLSAFFQDALGSKYKNIFIEYSTYFRYRYINRYSIEDTTKILNIFNKDFEKEKWDNCINIKYLITKVLFPAINSEYTKEQLIEICKVLI